jgi:glycosyltransferase involved in cell wall biosynthesis
MQKSLVFVITDYPYGGAQTQVIDLAIRLKARGWKVGVMSIMTPEAPPLIKMLDDAGIPWKTLDVQRGKINPGIFLKMRHILKEWQPSVVHSHMVHANIFTRLARLISSMPVLICTAHNINEGGKIRMLAYRFTDFLCEHTTNVSQAAVERYIDIKAAPKDKISFIPNGIDFSRFRPNKEIRSKLRNKFNIDDHFVWLAVGRLEEQKDYPNMLTSFSKMLEHHRLLIVGEGPLLASLQELSKSLGVEARVSFLGRRTDVADLMNAADAYLMSSAYEGLPMVLLEAAASELPMVATNVGGNREIILEGQNGYLVKAHDSDALASAMQRFAALELSQRQVMGKVAREHVIATYDLDRVVDQWEGLYLKLGGRRQFESVKV